MVKWEHSSVILKLKQKKGLVVSRKDLLQGLEDESIVVLKDMGDNGWELVAVIPFMSGKIGMFAESKAGTDALIAFLKRQQG